MATKKSGLELLREPFPANQISLLPKPYKKDSQKGKCNECGGYHGLPAVHLSYVGHAALTDRLLDADPNWTWEPLALKDGLPLFDASGGLWIKLTICGVTRLGYGHAEGKSYSDIGSREKEVIGDALRNAAMRFGAALDLWHKGQLHSEEDQNGVHPTSDPQRQEPVAQPASNGDPEKAAKLERLADFDAGVLAIAKDAGIADKDAATRELDKALAACNFATGAEGRKQIYHSSVDLQAQVLEALRREVAKTPF